MIVRGRWLRGRPYVSARIVIPRLEVFTDSILFLLDTGAESTTVHWSDRQLFRTESGDPLPLDTEFEQRRGSVGIGDMIVEYGREEAYAVFLAEQGHWLAANDPITVNVALRPDRGLPSLLGQDVLRRTRVDLNAPQDELTLQWPPGAARALREP